MPVRWMRITWTAALSVAVSAGALSACSGGSDTSMGSGGSGVGTTTSSGQGGTGQGTGGTGGSCGDIQTDPMHCGACNNPCAPGQTCQAGACTCGTAVVGFAAGVQPIFTASCALNNCHKPSVVMGVPVAPKAGLDLTAGVAHGEVVDMQSAQCAMSGGRTLVVPGSPTDSYLVDKTMGVDLCGTGKRMPPLMALSTAKIQTISDWICAGALND